jgi:hypothetical protein
LLAGTNLAGGTVVSTKPRGGAGYDVRNIVVFSLLEVLSSQQLRNDLVDTPSYKRLTAVPLTTLVKTPQTCSPNLPHLARDTSGHWGDARNRAEVKHRPLVEVAVITRMIGP